MKTDRPFEAAVRWITHLAIAAIVILPPDAALGQYSMQRFSIDCGGGASTGGTLALSGTAGQSEAGTMSGGAFALAGGFWFGGQGAASVDEPGAPTANRISATRFDSAKPNPSRGSTMLSFNLARPEVVSLEIFDVQGERVRMLLGAPQIAGLHQVLWDGTDEKGAEVPSGIYLARFHAGSFGSVAKVMILR